MPQRYAPLFANDSTISCGTSHWLNLVWLIKCLFGSWGYDSWTLFHMFQVWSCRRLQSRLEKTWTPSPRQGIFSTKCFSRMYCYFETSRLNSYFILLRLHVNVETMYFVLLVPRRRGCTRGRSFLLCPCHQNLSEIILRSGYAPLTFCGVRCQCSRWGIQKSGCDVPSSSTTSNIFTQEL